MAWFKDLAGKAEDFLNQIDQNAAVALQKEKGLNPDLLGGVETSNGSEEIIQREGQPVPVPKKLFSSATKTSGNKSAFSSVRSSPNLASLAPTRTSTPHSDDELMKFLNSSEHSEQSRSMAAMAEGDTVDHMVEVEEAPSFPAGGPTNGTEHSVSLSLRSTPSSELVEVVPEASPGAARVQLNGISPAGHVSEDLRTENSLLKTELRSINSEMSQLLRRTKAAERDCSSLQNELMSAQTREGKLSSSLQDMESVIFKLESQLEASSEQVAILQQRVSSLELERDKLLTSAESSDTKSLTIQSLQSELSTKEEELASQRVSQQQEVSALKERLAALEAEGARQTGALQAQLAQARADMQAQGERLRGELREAQAELEQYRTRAQRILQDKERLIAELRGDGPAGRADDAALLELEQLRSERELLREEAAQACARLQAARDELQASEARLDACREQAATAARTLQDSVQEERRRRQVAEEDCASQAEELRALREELARQCGLLARRVQERDQELSRLRAQLARRPASPPGGELESRLHSLTQTLVHRQTLLETATTERNALRLQLEKLENKYREAVSSLHQNPHDGIISVNDTDDAKAQVPSFLVESPFDTGMARRVKRAYSSLDAVSIRTGVFLRRYPLARILVVCYMVMLHLWVMLVLFTYTPQGQV
ncbi:golgin subfamily A member 5 [Bacillus rossius redtenbacheri]|uniref:golgin subfamily A member 5 n=1 Tax=Bacillus rossius redtenbacheri TaxID=93214 RepID=UPI002FDDB44C